MNNALVFAKVVACGSFSAAGRALAMPKTTVSKRVADLEGELGVRLLNRTTRRLAMTEAGARVHAHCTAAIRHMEDAEREAHALQQQPDGALTVAAPGAIGVHFLIPVISAFVARYPSVRVTLLSINEAADLKQHPIDAVIWAGTSMPPGHAVRLIAKVENAIYASKGYLARHGAPPSPQDLARHRVVAMVQALNGQRFTWSLKRGETEVTVVPAAPPVFLSNDAMAVLSMISAGYGVGAMPVRLVEQSAGFADLVAILPDWRLPSLELSALLRDASSLKTRLFVDLVSEYFQNIEMPQETAASLVSALA